MTEVKQMLDAAIEQHHQERSSYEPPREPVRKPRCLNPTRFLCRSEVRAYLLEQAKETRTHKFDRVSEEVLVEINERVRMMMNEVVRRQPSKGKTMT